jgi:uncharacterized membrane protein
MPDAPNHSDVVHILCMRSSASTELLLLHATNTTATTNTTAITTSHMRSLTTVLLLLLTLLLSTITTNHTYYEHQQHTTDLTVLLHVLHELHDPWEVVWLSLVYCKHSLHALVLSTVAQVVSLWQCCPVLYKEAPKWRICCEVAVPQLRCSSL